MLLYWLIHVLLEGMGAGKSIIGGGGGGGQIFIYSCSQTVKTIAFKGNK